MVLLYTIYKLDVIYLNLIENCNGIDDETKIYLKEKAVICHQKIKMMLFAEINAMKKLNEFEATQNMEVPCLFGDDETILLYHTESMILFCKKCVRCSCCYFSLCSFS